MEFPAFLFVHVVLLLDTTKKSLTGSPSHPPIKYLNTWVRTTWAFSFPAKILQTSLRLSAYDRCSKLLTIFVALCWTFPSKSMSLLYWGAWTLLMCLSSPEQRGRITSPHSLLIFCLTQTKKLLFFAARVPCWLMITLVSIETLKLSPSLYSAWGYSSPAVKLYIFLCWTTQD